MADGEVEVQVKADGVDDAAQELSGEDGAGGIGGVGAPDRGGGMLKQLGSIGRVLGVIAALLASIGPLLKFTEGVFKVLSAFLAPLSVMLMRLLMPVLRMFIKFLPRWLSWMETAETYLEFLGALADLLIIGPILDALPGNIWDLFESWGMGLLRAVTQLPADIGRSIANRIPGVSGSEGARAGRRAASVPASAAANTVLPGSGPLVQIAMNGGLDAFVEQVETDANVDLP